MVEYLEAEVSGASSRTGILRLRVGYDSSPSKRTEFQDLLCTDRAGKEMQELPLSRGNGDLSQAILFAIRHNPVTHFVLGDQERVVIDLGFSPDLPRLWRRHVSDSFLERHWGFGGMSEKTGRTSGRFKH